MRNGSGFFSLVGWSGFFVCFVLAFFFCWISSLHGEIIKPSPALIQANLSSSQACADALKEEKKKGGEGNLQHI